MTFLATPSHVALLVPSVDQAAERLRKYGFNISPAENWEGEGTREIYVERDQQNSLLLMEPAKPGAYQRAMEKRGPGLHHLAIDVLNLDEFLLSLGRSGWLLHPTSMRTMKKSRTAYLARPEFPALIEVQERKEIKQRPRFVTRVEIPFSAKLDRLPSAIGLGEIVFPSANNAFISCGGQLIQLSSLTNAAEVRIEK